MIEWAESLLPSQRASRKRMIEGNLKTRSRAGWLGPELKVALSYNTTHDISAGNHDNAYAYTAVTLRHNLHDGCRT